MRNQDHARYLDERIASEDRLAALARSLEARHIHAELAMHYRCERALLKAMPARREPSYA